MPRRAANGEAGFTLIELLIALALLAVTASLLVDAIAGARQALGVVDRRGVQASVPAIQSVLRRLLVEARTSPDTAERPDPDRAFAGESDRLRFVSRFVPQGQYGGLWHYEIALDTGEGTAGTHALVLTQQLVRPTWSANERLLRTVILDQVLAVSLRYFGAEDRESAAQWQDTWRHPYRLPHLVSVDVTFARTDRRQWTPLVVALPLSD